MAALVAIFFNLETIKLMKSLLRIALACAALVTFSAQAAPLTVSGSASATFNNPTAGSTNSGAGKNTFTWGNPSNFGVGANKLTFKGTSFDSVLNTPFKIGSLKYFNGTTAAGSNASNVDLSAVFKFKLPGAASVSSNLALALNSTPNTGNATANADFVTLSNMLAPTFFAISGANYKLTFTGFQNIKGDGFLQSNAQQLHVLEGKSATADLYASIEAVSAVPEPETYAMFGTGLALLGLFARRRKGAKNV
jgi:hypothetical protein